MNEDAKINLANRKVLDIFLRSRPIWTDVRPAVEVVPGMRPDLILIAGPPILAEKMALPVRTAVCGAAVYEGLASTPDDAWSKVLSGEIRVEAAQDHDCPCGSATATSASMPVMICENEEFGGKGYCVPHPGTMQDFLRWGVYNDSVQADLVRFRDTYGPALGEAVRAAGGIDVVEILEKTAGMGDENHNHQPAATMYLATKLVPYMLDCTFLHKAEIIKEYIANDRFFLQVMMAACACVASAAKRIPYSTIMVAMGGNGIEYGLQFAGTGDQWFTAPAPVIQGKFLRPDITEDDMLGFLGDSCITELYGLGGMSAIAGLGFLQRNGVTMEEIKYRTECARAVSIGEHTFATIPWDNNRGFPVCVDMRQVVSKGIAPISHGGGTMKAGRQGTIGAAALPMECFEKGLRAFEEKMADERLGDTDVLQTGA